MTPFDTALRVQRREVDAIKVSISVELERIASLELQQRDQIERMRDERMVAHALPFATDAWLAAAKRQREAIEQAAEMARARLTTLREQAVEVYGTMRAIEGAAERYQQEADRAVEAAEQAAIDDIAAARFLRERRKRARTA
ncbi:hypothetical protein ACX40Y_11550 [Sphingomonas sp. RS6]